MVGGHSSIYGCSVFGFNYLKWSDKNNVLLRIDLGDSSASSQFIIKGYRTKEVLALYFHDEESHYKRKFSYKPITPQMKEVTKVIRLKEHKKDNVDSNDL